MPTGQQLSSWQFRGCRGAMRTAWAKKRLGMAAAIVLFGVLPAMHFSYGWGYLCGVLEFLVLRRSRRGDSGAVPISR